MQIDISLDPYHTYNMKRISLEKPDAVKDILKKEILAFMREQNLSQYGVAKMLDLPTSYVNALFSSRDKPVSFSKLCEIANAIGMKLTLIIGRK